MTVSAGLFAATAVLLAAWLDRLLGDPIGWPHPVVVMGWWIQRLRDLAEGWAGDAPLRLRWAGGLITLVLVMGSGCSGWCLEQFALGRWMAGIAALQASAQVLMVVGLASALAGRSLEQAVMAVISSLQSNDLPMARQRLQWIVGRDTAPLDQDEIQRAVAETAAENSVDGLFAPLFWMLAGVVIWQGEAGWPGPLALAWAFKASSTLDSMLGYRRERLRWLGTAGARLDDLLVWLPCRLVMLTLPLVSQPWPKWWGLVQAAERDGAPDPSPNAGRAEAIYAHCVGVRLGGRNRYGDSWVEKPLLASAQPFAHRTAILRILACSRRLEALWLVLPVLLVFSCLNV
ncbi:MAG: adenosylcobinamide-phosphate synthase CbiB [Synechococcus sp.]